jgi:8-oxo-dGTP pyrophosphatase MutT (NUDIX family)
VEIRDTARLILLDPQDRLLLMRLDPPPGGGTELWVTLGGRIEAGETVLEAAQRELAEETGISDAEVGPIVWYGEQVLDVADRPRHLRESFVLVRCPGASITDAGWTDDEREAIVDMRWWSIQELQATDVTVKPPKLAGHLRSLLAQDPAAQGAPLTIDLQ